VLADFSSSLRDEADLEHLTNSILGVIRETMQPTYASLWLRKTDSHPRETQISRDENYSGYLSIE